MRIKRRNLDIPQIDHDSILQGPISNPMALLATHMAIRCNLKDATLEASAWHQLRSVSMNTMKHCNYFKSRFLSSALTRETIVIIQYLYITLTFTYTGLFKSISLCNSVNHVKGVGTKHVH